MNQINFVDQPKSFSEVSNKIKTLLVTNSQLNAVFAHEVMLDYKYKPTQQV